MATTARRVQRQEPLSSRKCRVRLLLGSYLDAAELCGHAPTEDIQTSRGREPAWREPRRNRELWYAGSYRPLERALDELRQRHRPVYRDTWDRWVLGASSLNGRRQARAHFGVALIALVMPSAIYVPQAISENAGYLPQEAKGYARKLTRL